MKPRVVIFSLSGISIAALAVAILAITITFFRPGSGWSKADLAALESLWIGSLHPLAPDPSNRYSDNPQAAAFGKKIFFDTRFSFTGDIACATCHLPDQLFQDGLPRAQGIGLTNRRTMTIVGTAYSPWLFWDGRKDSQWAQALGPLENPLEHGGNRTMYAHLVESYYQEEYIALFGPLPDLTGLPAHAGPVDDVEAHLAWDAMEEADRQAINQVYSNLGKAIAAYERRLMPGPSRFDEYVETALNKDASAMQTSLTGEEIAGLKLFIGKAGCIQCHNGPLFTDNHFHNTGVPPATGLQPDSGRAQGAKDVLADEFNCLGAYSDAGEGDCAELKYMIPEGDELLGQFKPPSLRNVAGRGPFMHAGQLATLEQVLDHYNRAPEAAVGHSELKPLRLSQTEILQIITFLGSLSGPLNIAPEWLSGITN